MKIRPKTVLLEYFNRWWLPAGGVFGSSFLLALVAFALAKQVVNGELSQTMVIGFKVLLGCVGISFLGLLAAAAWNLVQKQWARCFFDLAMILVGGALTVVAFGVLLTASIFRQGDDNFADNLLIPDNIAVAMPQPELDAQFGDAEDTFQRAILDALKNPDGNNAPVTADLTYLAQLENENPRILRRYLATSPAWRVFREEGAVMATRRWMIGPVWCNTMNGYYCKSDFARWHETGIPDFSTRCTIGLSAKPRWRGDGNTTRINAGDALQVKSHPGISGNGQESHCVISAGDLVVEIFERSAATERFLTLATLKQLSDEFRPLAESPTWETIKACLPPGSIKRGTPSFDLRNGFQTGLYTSEVWLNPGEPGMIYLKAFEVTQGKQLSEGRLLRNEGLKDRSNEWIGWSDDPEELFFSNATDFTIYEGDWGKPYAARFEVWFVPDSGSSERKLIEKVFRIEGWQA